MENILKRIEEFKRVIVDGNNALLNRISLSQTEKDDNIIKIEEASNRISDIDVEIEKCRVESDKVRIEFEEATASLRSTKEIGNYNLIDGSAIDGLIEKAEKNMTERLGEIEAVISSLSESLGNERSIIETLVSENEELDEAIFAYERSLGNVETEVLELINQALEKMSNLNESFVVDSFSNDRKSLSDIEIDYRDMRTNLVDLSKVLGDVDLDNAIDDVYSNDFDPQFQPVNQTPVTLDLSETQDEVIEEDVVKEDVVEEEPVFEDTIEEPIPEEVEPDVEDEPAYEQTTKDNTSTDRKDNYSNIGSIGLTDEQEKDLMDRMSPEEFEVITRILQNNGIPLEDLTDYAHLLPDVYDPRLLDETLSLLRGIGKNNDQLSFSTMLDHIIIADPTLIQEVVMQAYFDGQNPANLPIAQLTSPHYKNPAYLERDGQNVEELQKKYPVLLFSMPYLEFAALVMKDEQEREINNEGNSRRLV